MIFLWYPLTGTPVRLGNPSVKLSEPFIYNEHPAKCPNCRDHNPRHALKNSNRVHRIIDYIFKPQVVNYG